MHLRTRIRRDDRGVTLVEVLIAIVILAIIIVPMGNALISFFRNTNATTNRFAESHDEQIAAAYFAQDVQSIGVRNWSTLDLQASVEQNAPATSGTFPCGVAGTPAATLRFAWNDPTGASSTQQIIVSYVVETVSGHKQLHRLRCAGGSTTPTSDIIVVHNLLSAGTPTLTPTGSTIPQYVSWTLTIQASTGSGSPLVVTLYGQRRQT
jgi:prepilin-type N-terminal cleavage/methylation domain-containing protein